MRTNQVTQLVDMRTKSLVSNHVTKRSTAHTVETSAHDNALLYPAEELRKERNASWIPIIRPDHNHFCIQKEHFVIVLFFVFLQTSDYSLQFRLQYACL